MGVYNTYDNVQLKCGHTVNYITYKIGDRVDLFDGIYVGNRGYVVVHKKKLLATYEFITTSHSRVLEAEELYTATLTTVERLKDLRTLKCNQQTP